MIHIYRADQAAHNGVGGAITESLAAARGCSSAASAGASAAAADSLAGRGDAESAPADEPSSRRVLGTGAVWADIFVFAAAAPTTAATSGDSAE